MKDKNKQKEKFIEGFKTQITKKKRSMRGVQTSK